MSETQEPKGPVERTVRRSPKAEKLKAALEKRGWRNVRVWWERITPPLEMCGHGGGWMAELPDYPGGIEPLGLNFEEALWHAQMAIWLSA